MKKQSIGEMALRFGIDASVCAFMGCVAKAVIPADAKTGTVVLATIGGACVGWALADMCGDMMMEDLKEIADAFAEAKKSIQEAKEEES